MPRFLLVFDGQLVRPEPIPEIFFFCRTASATRRIKNNDE
jgi:hypothetical protein